MAMRFLSNGCNLYHVDWEGETKIDRERERGREREEEREKLGTIKNNYSAMPASRTFKCEEKFLNIFNKCVLFCCSFP